MRSTRIGGERHVAVVVQLADRDAQREGVAELRHGVVVESGELAHPDAGLGQDLDHEPPTRVGVARQCRRELLHGRVVEELRQRLVGLWEVAGEDQRPGRRVVVVPVAQPLEEGAQQFRVGCGW